MKKISLVLSCLVFLAGCAALMEDRLAGNQPVSGGIGGTGSPEYNGIGGTGKTPDSGLGGTGKMALGPGVEKGSGIGGTGKIAQGPGGGGIGGTGIVGRITAFGSIWVNGAHITFDQDTPVKRNDQLIQQQEFKIGQVVAVLSDHQGRDYQAQRITIVHEVVGPISRIEGNQLWVLGQQVMLAQANAQKTLVSELQSSAQEIPVSELQAGAQKRLISELQAGDWIQVSGHRRQDQIIVASRLDAVEPRERVELIGEITGDEGSYRIGNQAIQLDALIALDAQDKREFVSGHLDEGVLVAEQLGEDPIAELLDDAENLILEGFMFEAEDQFSLSGVDLMLPTAVDMQAIESDMPVRINAVLNDQVFEVDYVHIMSDAEYEDQEFVPLYDSGDDVESYDYYSEELESESPEDLDQSGLDPEELESEALDIDGLDNEEFDIEEGEMESFDHEAEALDIEQGFDLDEWEEDFEQESGEFWYEDDGLDAQEFEYEPEEVLEPDFEEPESLDEDIEEPEIESDAED